jgi:hypothetical protein
MKETQGKAPSAMWYVVNHNKDASPENRKTALSDHKLDVDAFSENGGLIIDTVELFKLVKAVQAKEILPRDAQKQLIESSGCYRFTTLASSATITSKNKKPSRNQ